MKRDRLERKGLTGLFFNLAKETFRFTVPPAVTMLNY